MLGVGIIDHAEGHVDGAAGRGVVTAAVLGAAVFRLRVTKLVAALIRVARRRARW